MEEVEWSPGREGGRRRRWLAAAGAAVAPERCRLGGSVGGKPRSTRAHGFRVLLAPREGVNERTKSRRIRWEFARCHALTRGKTTNMSRHEQGLDMEHGLVSTRGSQRWLRAMAESLVADAGEAV